MIKANQLTKIFGEGESMVRALKEVNLVIEKGEMVSIVGPSGCGKSTLLHVLSGIDDPTEGEVYIDGFDLYGAKDNKRSAFRLTKMGFVFQAFHLIPVLTALENVALPLIGQGLSTKEANDKARAALKQVGLEEKLYTRPGQLSGGQNQRIAIARAIVTEPAVIWADEPTGALDSQTAQQIVGLLRHINDTMGTTIVVVTHDLSISKQTDRIFSMKNGRIIKTDTVNNFDISAALKLVRE
ncbi:ABC transporter ATP-binding protein [Bacillus chungangensis]|uniref:ABC transport system ATP-binding protein n=1 Tax=Bacillus chungangensis TaxID=587633 RepID=A0ABT9WQV6_9BACI|nr:ABC transporter ATP-binding protein [Bacillus chungangensis]MDQ0175673.1 putative ABC transport system ATP-binding protein [Bacillus chungangensis]